MTLKLKVKKYLLSWMMLFLGFPALAQYSGGAGTSVSPYQISTFSDLELLSSTQSDWDKFFIQTTDIDASSSVNTNSGAGFSPIGFNYMNSFSGNYNGQGFVIDGLTINRPSQNNVGLFGEVFTTASVQNIKLTNVSINAGNYIGGLAGVNNGAISNCFVSGNINGNIASGGLIGGNFGFISTSYFQGTVNGTFDVGGFVGSNSNTISNSYCFSTVVGTGSVGGFVGYSGSSSISNCYSVGTVSGGTIGGFVGVTTGTFSSCFYDSNVSLLSDANGGATAQSTTLMKTQTTFSGWNFTITWKMGACASNGEYPVLQWAFPLPFNGSGTLADPYQVNTFDDLVFLSQTPCLWNKFFIQTANINASASASLNGGLGFSPIGNSSVNMNFNGSYNGDGMFITNLTINRPNQDYVGLFGFTNGAIVQHVSLLNASIVGRDYVGSVIGVNMSPSVSNCVSFGNVTGRFYVGGFVGQNSNGISHCYHKGSVVGDQVVGGFVGRNAYAYINNCFSIGDVTGNQKVGGFSGDINSYSINFCYSVGNVLSTGTKGGFHGFVDAGSSLSSYYDSDVSQLTDANGGSVATSTLDMKNFNTYLGWNSSNWNIDVCKNNGYPYLIDLYIDFTYPDAPTGLATQSFCLGATVSDLEGAGVDVKWYNNNGTLLGTGEFLSTGWYYATQTIDGCESNEALEVSVTVDEETTTTTTISECDSYTWAANGQTYTSGGTYSVVSGCQTEELVLTITNSSLNSVNITSCGSYTWGVNNQTYNSSNTYVVSNGCQTEELVLTILPNPDVTTTVVTETITANASNATYQWIDCNNANNPIAGATNQSFTALISGNYAVEVTNNGCTATSTCVFINLSSVLENEHVSTLQMYPNPVFDIINIKTEKIGVLTIFSVEGKLIEVIELNSLSNNIDVSHYSKGVYIVRFIENNGTYHTAKFTKE